MREGGNYIFFGNFFCYMAMYREKFEKKIQKCKNVKKNFPFAQLFSMREVHRKRNFFLFWPNPILMLVQAILILDNRRASASTCGVSCFCSF